MVAMKKKHDITFRVMLHHSDTAKNVWSTRVEHQSCKRSYPFSVTQSIITGPDSCSNISTGCKWKISHTKLLAGEQVRRAFQPTHSKLLTHSSSAAYRTSFFVCIPSVPLPLVALLLCQLGTARRGSCKFPYWTSDAMQIRPIVQLMTMNTNKHVHLFVIHRFVIAQTGVATLCRLNGIYIL